MVMERIDGWTLGQMVRDQRLDQRQAVDLVALALDGLAAAHASGLIHRDLKPENIMVLRPDGSSGPAQRVKLLDFGLVFTSGARESRITKSGLVFGTPAYMCPEQARGGVEMDERSDIYSMSVVLYEAVAGRLPFDCDQPHQFMFKHVSDPPDPATRHHRAGAAEGSGPALSGRGEHEPVASGGRLVRSPGWPR